MFESSLRANVRSSIFLFGSTQDLTAKASQTTNFDSIRFCFGGFSGFGVQVLVSKLTQNQPNRRNFIEDN